MKTLVGLRLVVFVVWFWVRIVWVRPVGRSAVADAVRVLVQVVVWFRFLVSAVRSARLALFVWIVFLVCVVSLFGIMTPLDLFPSNPKVLVMLSGYPYWPYLICTSRLTNVFTPTQPQTPVPHQGIFYK